MSFQWRSHFTASSTPLPSQNPRSLHEHQKQIWQSVIIRSKIRSSTCAKTCKNPKALRPGLVQTAVKGQYQIFQGYAAVGSTSPQLFNRFVEELHPSPPAEGEQTDVLAQMERITAPPNHLDDPSVYVVGGLDNEVSTPACIGVRGLNDGAGTPCVVQGSTGSDVNNPELLPPVPTSSSRPSDHNPLEAATETPPPHSFPTSTLSGALTHQSTPLNTFGFVSAQDPLNNQATSTWKLASPPTNGAQAGVHSQGATNGASDLLQTGVGGQISNGHRSLVGPQPTQARTAIPFSKPLSSLPTELTLGRYTRLSTPKAKATPIHRLSPPRPVKKLPNSGLTPR